ncbi:MAG TPA: LysR family transcriptional regulator [Rhizobium sp.]
MLDGVSLDHLRTFVAAADEGSFSAAGRKLGRAQSVVSQTIANLEAQLELTLFERTARYPQLTAGAKSLLPSARQIVRDADRLKAQARSLSAGLEPVLSIVVDVMFPQRLLTEAVSAFASVYPGTPLRLHVEALGAVAELVVDGRCSVGIMGTYPMIPPSLSSERLLSVEMVSVVAPSHALARWRGPVPLDQAETETQLVLTDRSALTKGVDLGVQSSNTWRLSDLGAKHAFLVAGLGWGHMPLPMVADDLAAGQLVQIMLEGPGPGLLPMQAIYKADSLPGPAARWLLDRIRSSANMRLREWDGLRA